MVRTKGEVAQIIEDFLHGRGGDGDWDDFTSFTIDDPSLDLIRAECTELSDVYPASEAAAAS
jgi:hypothetical protein